MRFSEDTMPLSIFPRLVVLAMLSFIGLTTVIGQVKESDYSAESPFINSLGMKFVPAGTPGVLFSAWNTRVKDYQAFCTASQRDWLKPFFEQGPTHPAVDVSMDDAIAFCQWLTEKEIKEGILKPNQTYRLPTDAEWSKAVGLEESADGTPEEKSFKIKDEYPWGKGYPPPLDAGNYNRKGDGNDTSKQSDLDGTDGYSFTSPVGAFKPNRYGLFDMGGNVWQWCQDRFGSKADANDRYRVLRGGSWFSPKPEYRLSSARWWDIRHSRVYDEGFRCVLSSSGSP